MSSPNSPRTPTFGEGDADVNAPGALGGVPLGQLGTTNLEGSAPTFVRTDATVGILDNTNPAAIATTAAAGVSLKAARRDHVHNLPADLTVQRVAISLDGANVGSRKRINFVQGGGCTITITDNAVNNRIDVTISVP